MPWRREQLPTPVFWPGEFHGLGLQRVRHHWVTFTYHKQCVYSPESHPCWSPHSPWIFSPLLSCYSLSSGPYSVLPLGKRDLCTLEIPSYANIYSINEWRTTWAPLSSRISTGTQVLASVLSTGTVWSISVNIHFTNTVQVPRKHFSTSFALCP